MPESYTSEWRSVTFPTVEHRGQINPLENVPYRELVAAYGAYIRHLRERVVLPSLLPEETTLLSLDQESSQDTLRFLTRAAFGGQERFNEILRHMRTIAEQEGVGLNEIIGNPEYRERLLSAIPYNPDDLSTKTVRRALITTVQARELQNTHILREIN